MREIMEEPKKIPLTNFKSQRKEPQKIRLKPLVKIPDENNKQNNS
jgi:hypothetical protein